MNAPQLIDKQIADIKDWRGTLMAQLRKIILQADSTIKEEWKWETGVWTCNGLVCAMSAFKDHVKLNFFKGVSLQDPQALLNAGLESKKHRAIDFSEKHNLHVDGITQLVKQAVSLNAKK